MRDLKTIELVNGQKDYRGIPNKCDSLAQIYVGEMSLRVPDRPNTLSGPL
jgi:hypothetical protein